ncbi:MAG: CHAT domain-containing protein, partial [Planctomycetes bacterium]|nr:CHAT domain-containing protein [Planctomycetota bacterium]
MIPVLELTFSDVVGDPWEGRATVRFQGEPSKPFPVREGMTSKQRAEVRWYVEQYMDLPEGGNATRAAALEKELAAYGHALWDGLKSDVVLQWLGVVEAAGEGRLELRAATPRDEGAFRTPWELMRVGGGEGRLLHQLGVNVVRRVRANLPRLHPADTKEGLRVLTVVARPAEAGFLDPRYTPEAILTALESRPEVTVDFARPGTLSALVDALEVARQDGCPFHVVHFDGHGTTLPKEAGVGALCFEKDDGSLDLVRAPRFGDLMSGFNIPLVVLDACRTATKSFAQDTLAGALLRQGVGTVLAMGHAVHVDMTRELMGAFYEGIARGWSLGVAVKHARNRAYANPQRRTRIAADAPTVKVHDWFVPQLYQGGEDPKLLEKKPRRRKARPAPPMIGFPPAPRAGFQGRGYQLHKLERLVLQRLPVVIHAPGGMGKTALVREAAHWWGRTGLFPDGAVFVSLEGLASPDRVVGSVGEALEGVEFHNREDPRAWIEDQLTRRRMLIVWDNYESVLPAFNGGRPAPPEFAQLARAWTAGG